MLFVSFFSTNFGLIMDNKKHLYKLKKHLKLINLYGNVKNLQNYSEISMPIHNTFLIIKINKITNNKKNKYNKIINSIACFHFGISDHLECSLIICKIYIMNRCTAHIGITFLNE